MAWILDDSRPIYLQIEDLIKANIIAGVYQPGQKLPSVRDLAAEAAVNPNTMQKALSLLESEGLLYSQGTIGRFVSTDASVLDAAREKMNRETVRTWISEAKSLGISRDKLIKYIQEEDEQ